MFLLVRKVFLIHHCLPPTFGLRDPSPWGCAFLHLNQRQVISVLFRVPVFYVDSCLTWHAPSRGKHRAWNTVNFGQKFLNYCVTCHGSSTYLYNETVLRVCVCAPCFLGSKVNCNFKYTRLLWVLMSAKLRGLLTPSSEQ